MFPGQLENIPAINVSWSAVIATSTERMTHNLCQDWKSKDNYCVIGSQENKKYWLSVGEYKR